LRTLLQGLPFHGRFSPIGASGEHGWKNQRPMNGAKMGTCVPFSKERTMAEIIDDQFWDRADAHINLSNDQLKNCSLGEVSASMMYSVARFNAWVSACDYDNPGEMKAARQETLDYFVTQYRKMLEENLDDYIENFNKHMKRE
jgi:hypothetical protein